MIRQITYIYDSSLRVETGITGEYNWLDPKSGIRRAHWLWQSGKDVAGGREGEREDAPQVERAYVPPSLEERAWRHGSKRWWHVTGIVRAGASLCLVVIRFSIAMNRACFDGRFADDAAHRLVSSNPENRLNPYSAHKRPTVARRAACVTRISLVRRNDDSRCIPVFRSLRIQCLDIFFLLFFSVLRYLSYFRAILVKRGNY